MEAGNLAGFAFEAVAQDINSVSFFARELCCGYERGFGRGDDFVARS